jgi:hypothetical protein
VGDIGRFPLSEAHLLFIRLRVVSHGGRQTSSKCITLGWAHPSSENPRGSSLWLRASLLGEFHWAEFSLKAGRISSLGSSLIEWSRIVGKGVISPLLGVFC